MQVWGRRGKLFYSEERYILEGKVGDGWRRTSFPSVYNLTRQLKLVGNVRKSYKDYKYATQKSKLY